MKDFMYVAETKDAWRQAAIAQGIARAETDPETGMLTLVYNEGYYADHIGPIGSDLRFHVNLRVSGDTVEREFIRSKRYKPHSATGTEWVPPEIVTSPYRIWFGGMDYFAEDIPQPEPTVILLPFISMITANLGDLLVCAPGVWSGNPDLVTYQWLRDGAEINQAITPNHTANLLDRGHTLTCIETAKNEAGSASASSNGVTVL